MTAGNSNNASSSAIKIFARVRPPRPNSKLAATAGRYWTKVPATPGASSGSEDPPRIGFLVPRDEAAGLINNQRESYEFKFDHVFGVDTNQEEVFDIVAKPVISRYELVLLTPAFMSARFTDEEFGGERVTRATRLHIFSKIRMKQPQTAFKTTFTQPTGSGKTFTITGGAERYADRGLIPRTLQFVFKEAQKNPSVQYSFHISYLEIYNEIGYDLLDSSRDAKRLEDLPKVTLQEDADEMIHLRNLSAVPVANEEEALNLLFVGDTNRMIAETPSNPSSSRSHCIFIVGVTSRRDGEDVIRRSKLHLVDLAGSERVARTGIDGVLLKEAKYINLSLHYLEQVIIALHEQSLGKRAHIPYRNSMMTSVLRDSLGGNCKTTMIATVAIEDQLVDESISTCRFAQRVALIANNATLNEELDPHIVITRLKREIARLRAELAIARGDAGQNTDDELPDYEKERVKQAVDDYYADTSKESALILTDYRKIQYAFTVFKSYLLDARKQRPSEIQGNDPRVVEPSSTSVRAMTIDSAGLSESQLKQFDKLKTLVTHRDNEINILVGMIRKLKEQLTEKGVVPLHMVNRDASKKHALERSGVSMPDVSVKGDTVSGAVVAARAWQTATEPEPTTTVIMPIHTNRHHQKKVKSLQKSQHPSSSDLAGTMPTLTTEKARAFDIFRQAYPSSQWIDGQKTLLKGKYAEAKGLGESANKLRMEIKSLKEKLTDTSLQPDDKETNRQTLADRVIKYKQAYQQLKDLKMEIEHLQHLLEQARHRITRDFEHWYVTVYMPTEDGTGIVSQLQLGSMSQSGSPQMRAVVDVTNASEGVRGKADRDDGKIMTAPAAGAAAKAQTIHQLHSIQRHDNSDTSLAPLAGDVDQTREGRRSSVVSTEAFGVGGASESVSVQSSSSTIGLAARAAWPQPGSTMPPQSGDRNQGYDTDRYTTHAQAVISHVKSVPEEEGTGVHRNATPQRLTSISDTNAGWVASGASGQVPSRGTSIGRPPSRQTSSRPPSRSGIPPTTPFIPSPMSSAHPYALADDKHRAAGRSAPSMSYAIGRVSPSPSTITDTSPPTRPYTSIPALSPHVSITTDPFRPNSRNTAASISSSTHVDHHRHVSHDGHDVNADISAFYRARDTIAKIAQAAEGSRLA